MATSHEWKSLKFSTWKDPKTGTPVKEHPLKNTLCLVRDHRVSTEKLPEITRNLSLNSTQSLPITQVLDPLSEFVLEMDPLSRAATEVEELYLSDSKSLYNEEETYQHKMEPWSKKRTAILSKYITSEKLCIITNFLPGGEKILVKAQSSSVDKVQHRLDQLDTFEESTQKKLNVSQTEYVSQIEQLNKELVIAWNTEQRVKALKIAIQCAKLLTDTDVLQFYPSKFVLITDILETFGKIVYERLKSKAELKPGVDTKASLPNDFSPDMVPESAKETCLNWFYKIASIRELVPRIYVELALIKSYDFISTHDCPEGLLRISDMIIGIGNPLVAVYARCYLCIVSINLMNTKTDYTFVQKCFTGFIDCYQHVFSRCVISETHAQKMNMTSYLTLYIPALNFMIEAIASYNAEAFLSELLSICKRNKNSSLLLNSVISVFKPNGISTKILEILDLIEYCADYQAIPLSMLLRALGNCINSCPPPAEHTRLLLTTVSRHLSSIKDPGEFITCLDAWVIYFVKNLSSHDLNSLIGDIIERLVPNREFENHYNELKNIINKIVSNTPDFESLLIIDNFLHITDLFQEESVRVEVCKNILVLSNNEQKTNDPVVINTLMYLGSIIHDSVNALIPEDEYRQIGEIICGILRRIDFGKNFEQQLNFYVMARGAFCNLDVVLAELVQKVNTLSVNARQTVKGLHTKKSGDFVRACAAYCFITIPSVISEKTRLQLYLLSGQVALFNQCFGQAEASFKAAWSIIVNMKANFHEKESFLIPHIKQTISALLVLPDNPERGVLSILRLLLNTLKSLELEDDYVVALLYINVINMLSAMAQDEFLYQIDKVESNDALYGADPKFVAEIDKICSVLLGEIKTALNKHPGSKNQYNIALELFTTVVARGDLSHKEMRSLATELWEIIRKNTQSDKNLLVRTKLYLDHSAKLKDRQLIQTFIQQLKL